LRLDGIKTIVRFGCLTGDLGSFNGSYVLREIVSGEILRIDDINGVYEEPRRARL
jgi:hypothetical protein